MKTAVIGEDDAGLELVTYNTSLVALLNHDECRNRDKYNIKQRK